MNSFRTRRYSPFQTMQPLTLEDLESMSLSLLTGKTKIQTFSIKCARPQVNWARSSSKGRKSYRSRSTSATETIVSIAWGIGETPAQVLSDPEEIVSAVGSSGSKANSQALFGENYARLQKLKQEYDPDLTFFKWCPITPQA